MSKLRCPISEATGGCTCHSEGNFVLIDTIEGTRFGRFQTESEAYIAGLDYDLTCGQVEQADYDFLLDAIKTDKYDELNAAWWEVRPISGPGSRRPLNVPC